MFKNQNLGSLTVVPLGDYHPYRLKDSSVNPAFDTYSGRILDVKTKMLPSEIRKFANQIDELIESNVAICYVPSCDSAKTDSGIKRIAVEVSRGTGRVNATDCLIRHTTIPKLANGGNRHKQVHLDSIKVENVHLIRGKKVLLIDDVTTSNNSLIACKELLLDAGAAEVHCLALGQTVKDQ